jgi:hypothetical protein
VTAEITVSWDMNHALLFKNNLLPVYYMLKMEAAGPCTMLLPIHQLQSIRCQKVALFIIATRTSNLTQCDLHCIMEIPVHTGLIHTRIKIRSRILCTTTSTPFLGLKQPSLQQVLQNFPGHTTVKA